MILYAWYSIDSYKRGEREYVYSNEYNQETICSTTTNSFECEYKYKKEYIFCGEVTAYLREL